MVYSATLLKTVIIGGSTLFVGFLVASQSLLPLANRQLAEIQFGFEKLAVELALTDEERIKGLSGRRELDENTGLLFIFQTDGNHGIWMRDMRFPIDIIWLDRNRTVVDIEENVSPETWPKVFRPDTKARYVVETEAGWGSAHGVAPGITATLQFNTRAN